MLVSIKKGSGTHALHDGGCESRARVNITQEALSCGRGLRRGAGLLLGFCRHQIGDDEARLLLVVTPGGGNDNLQIAQERHHVVDRGLDGNRVAQIAVGPVGREAVARQSQLVGGVVDQRVELAERSIESLHHHRVDGLRIGLQIAGIDQFGDDVIDILRFGRPAVLPEFVENKFDALPRQVDVVDRSVDLQFERLIIVRIQHDGVHGEPHSVRSQAEGSRNHYDVARGGGVVGRLEMLHVKLLVWLLAEIASAID